MGEAMPKAELAVELNRICAAYSDRMRELGAPDMTRQRKAAKYFRDAAKLSRKQTEEMARFTAEPGRAAYKEELDRLGLQTTQLLEDLSVAARASDQERGAELLAQLGAAGESFARASRKLGATKCAEA